MNKRFIGSFLTATLTLATFAQSGSQSGSISPYSQYGLGVLADQSQGFNRGMNGTGIALRNGTMVNTLNPASYSAIDSLTMLFDAGLSLQLTNFKENGTSVNGRNANFDYAVGLFRMCRHLGVSFGLLPFSDVGYSYTTSSYLDNNLGSLKESYTGSGGFHQTFVGAGWNPVKPLSIGFNFVYFWGCYDRSVSTTATTTVNSLSKTYKANVNSYSLTLGMQWQQPVGKKDVVTLGATWGLGHKLGADPTCDIINVNASTLVSDTTTFVVKDGISLPTSWAAGVAWNHDNKLTLAADFSLQKWGNIDFPSYDENKKEYTLQSGLLMDRKRMSMGADYVADPNHPTSYFKHIHFRVGAAYATPYYKINGQDGPKEFSLSAGMALPLLSKWNTQGAMRPVLNISAQWVRTSAEDLITDNSFRICVGLTFNERWFAKWRID